MRSFPSETIILIMIMRSNVTENVLCAIGLKWSGPTVSSGSMSMALITHIENFLVWCGFFFSCHNFSKKMAHVALVLHWVSEVIRWLERWQHRRVLASLAENPGLAPSTHTVGHNHP